MQILLIFISIIFLQIGTALEFFCEKITKTTRLIKFYEYIFIWDYSSNRNETVSISITNLLSHFLLKKW